MNVPASVLAAAIGEFLGSIFSLLVSLVFLLSEIDRYHGSKQLVRIYGPASAFHFYNPAFYVVYILLPLLFGLLGIVCAFGLFGLREWARKGTLFLATVPVLVGFFPPTQAKERYLLLEEASILCFLRICSFSLSP